jgi:hypothetical protein
LPDSVVTTGDMRSRRMEKKKKKELVIKLLFRGQGDDRGANPHRSAGGALPADCGTAMAAVVGEGRRERRRFRQKMMYESR